MSQRITRSAAAGDKKLLVLSPVKRTTKPKPAKKTPAPEPAAKATTTPKNAKQAKDKGIEKQDQNVKEDEEIEDVADADSIYDFTAKDIKGNPVSLDKYKGNVCIIVNVASKCGHTKSNYEQLVQLHEKYSDEKGLKILAFPCNQFGTQEPGTPEAICKFADKYNVKFDMFDKIQVNGADAHPLYKFLSSKLPEAKGKGDKIKWNFTKFIIDTEGKPVERFASSTKPLTLVDTLNKYW